MNKRRPKKQSAAMAALRSLEPQRGQISSASNEKARVIFVSPILFELEFRKFKGREPTAAERKRQLHT
jgi:hypothetical protein